MSNKITHIDTVYDGWSRYLIATVALPDGKTVRRAIEDHGRAVGVLPYDPVRRTAVLVRQFRAPIFYAEQRQHTLEAVAGTVENEAPAECARREAMEEAGLRLHALEHVATAWSMPGVSTERMDLYLAAYAPADRIGDGGGLPEEHEGITVVEMPLAELAAMADDGRLTDMKALALVQTLRLRRPDLFADQANSPTTA